MTDNNTKQNTGIRNIVVRAVLIVAWALLAIVLTITATLLCSVKFLTPERLTPLITKVANSNLNATVSLGRAELGFRPSFPVLELRLDSLLIISHAFDTIPACQVAALPEYADTLLSIDAIRAGLNVGKMLTHGQIYISDATLLHPEFNMVTDRDGRCNLDIYTSSAAEDADSDDTEEFSMPAIVIHHFGLTEPRPIRYFSAVDTMDIAIQLQLADLDGNQSPQYTVAIDGRLNSTLIQNFLRDNALTLSLDGDLCWDPNDPCLITADDLGLNCGFIHSAIGCALRMGNVLTLESASIDVEPMRIDSIINHLPNELSTEYGLSSSNLSTDMAIGLGFDLTAPYKLTTDTVPSGIARVTIDNAVLKYQQLDLHDISLDVKATLDGSSYDNAVIDLIRFTAAGPATDIEASGTFSKLLSDPHFDCTVKGNMRLNDLPPVISEMIGGVIDGRLTMSITAIGDQSMLQLGRLHDLDVRGDAEAYDLSYNNLDGSQQADITHALFRFGSQLASHDASAQANTLAAMIRVDSAQAVVDGVEMQLGNMSLGLGVENGGRPTDTLSVMPMGGGLHIGALNVKADADSAGMRLRNLQGHVAIRRHLGDSKVPELSLEAGIDRLLAGAPIARMVIRDANLKVLTYLRPERRKARQQMHQLIDSLAHVYPNLSTDSIQSLARAMRRRQHNRPGMPPPRRAENIDTEVLEWGLSNDFRRFLNDWYLDGEISTSRARLRTPLFPIRNKLDHIHLTFSNDSIAVDSVRYTGGRSDLSINGSITNLRRSLAGRGHAPLKINFSIHSDTLDINQFAAATFAGAAYADKLRKGIAENESFDSNDDFDQDAVIDADTTAVAALLIPTNIDANIHVCADNIYYSDLCLHDFSGDLQVFDGALNLSGLQAFSDLGDIHMSALYSAPRVKDIKFGMGLQLDNFNIERFLNFMPAIDSIMPLMRGFAGTVNADIAATVNIDSLMNFDLPTLDAAIRLSGKDLVFIDADTYSKIGKWLRFRNRADNSIKSMDVQLLVRDNNMQIYPFQFNVDRYTLGIVGYNDLAMNFNYHIAVLKSPLPFKFGINIKGNADKYKIRLGRARFNADQAASNIGLVDTVRVNLIEQIRGVFRRGVSRSQFAHVDASPLGNAGNITNTDADAHADSLALKNEGMLPPDSIKVSIPSKHNKK